MATTPEMIGAVLTALAPGIIALWRAAHADKVAVRVEAKTDATQVANAERLKGGAETFEALRTQNTAQGERIAANETEIRSLKDRVLALELRLDQKRNRIATNTSRIEALEARLAELLDAKKVEA